MQADTHIKDSKIQRKATELEMAPLQEKQRLDNGMTEMLLMDMTCSQNVCSNFKHIFLY